MPQRAGVVCQLSEQLLSVKRGKKQHKTNKENNNDDPAVRLCCRGCGATAITLTDEKAKRTKCKAFYSFTVLQFINESLLFGIENNPKTLVESVISGLIVTNH